MHLRSDRHAAISCPCPNPHRASDLARRDLVTRYYQLPYPSLVPMQEFNCDVGITANCHAFVTDCVWRVFADEDVFTVRQLIGPGLMTLTGGEAGVTPETGLALRRCYFLEPTILELTRLRVFHSRLRGGNAASAAGPARRALALLSAEGEAPSALSGRRLVRYHGQ